MINVWSEQNTAYERQSREWKSESGAPDVQSDRDTQAQSHTVTQTQPHSHTRTDTVTQSHSHTVTQSHSHSLTLSQSHSLRPDRTLTMSTPHQDRVNHVRISLSAQPLLHPPHPPRPQNHKPLHTPTTRDHRHL